MAEVHGFNPREFINLNINIIIRNIEDRLLFTVIGQTSHTYVAKGRGFNPWHWKCICNATSISIFYVICNVTFKVGIGKVYIKGLLYTWMVVSSILYIEKILY